MSNKKGIHTPKNSLGFLLADVRADGSIEPCKFGSVHFSSLAHWPTSINDIATQIITYVEIVIYPEELCNEQICKKKNIFSNSKYSIYLHYILLLPNL